MAQVANMKDKKYISKVRAKLEQQISFPSPLLLLFSGSDEPVLHLLKPYPIWILNNIKRMGTWFPSKIIRAWL